jgi:hypothetical protein
MDGQTIHADAPLRTLLNLAETDQLRILNLHRYFGDHCPLPRRRAPVAIAVAPVVPVALHRYELYDEPDARDLDGPDDGVI